MNIIIIIIYCVTAKCITLSHNRFGVVTLPVCFPFILQQGVYLFEGDHVEFLKEFLCLSNWHSSLFCMMFVGKINSRPFSEFDFDFPACGTAFQSVQKAKCVPTLR